MHAAHRGSPLNCTIGWQAKLLFSWMGRHSGFSFNRLFFKGRRLTTLNTSTHTFDNFNTGWWKTTDGELLLYWWIDDRNFPARTFIAMKFKLWSSAALFGAFDYPHHSRSRLFFACKFKLINSFDYQPHLRIFLPSRARLTFIADISSSCFYCVRFKSIFAFFSGEFSLFIIPQLLPALIVKMFVYEFVPRGVRWACFYIFMGETNECRLHNENHNLLALNISFMPYNSCFGSDVTQSIVC